MAWTPLELRDAALQQQIATAAAAAQLPLPPADFYNQNDLGLMEPAQLSAWLAEASPQTDSATSTAASEVAEPEQLSVITEGEGFDARSLRWLRLNGRTAEDKAYAKQRYRRLLFELWRKHIADTGQTYYPKLRDDLMDRFQLISDQDQS